MNDEHTTEHPLYCACCGLVFAENPGVRFEIVRDEEMIFGECIDREACAERTPPGGWHS